MEKKNKTRWSDLSRIPALSPPSTHACTHTRIDARFYTHLLPVALFKSIKHQKQVMEDGGPGPVKANVSFIF